MWLRPEGPPLFHELIFRHNLAPSLVRDFQRFIFISGPIVSRAEPSAESRSASIPSVCVEVLGSAEAVSRYLKALPFYDSCDSKIIGITR